MIFCFSYLDFYDNGHSPLNKYFNPKDKPDSIHSVIIDGASIIYNYFNPILDSQDKPESNYNVIIDAPSMMALRNGWKIITDDSQFSKEFTNLNEYYKKKVIVLAGDYNTGKSYVLNNLEKRNFPSSYSNSTPALAFFESSIDPSYVFIDTMGQKRLASSSMEPDSHSHKLRDIKAMDNFMYGVYDIADIIIEVIGPGKNTDICAMKDRHARYRGLKDPKTVIVVHNLSNFKDPEAVEKHIRDDIVNGEIGGEEKKKTNNCRFWDVKGVYHYVMAEEGSKAGDIYNECTINSINKAFIVDVIINNKRNLLREIMDLTEKKAPTYFKDPNHNNETFVAVTNDNTKLAGEQKTWKMTFDTIMNIYQSYMGTDQPKEKKNEKYNVEFHNWEVIKHDGYIRLKNNTFDLEYIYSDCCGFDKMGFVPSVDIISTDNSFSIAVDAPLSKVFWFCNRDAYDKIFLIIDRKIPSYSKPEESLDQRKFGSYRSEFELPRKRDWIDCKELAASNVCKEGVCYVFIKDKNSSIDVGTPFENEPK
ncbi:hypothetical protein DICPUDRAFT_80300 [Dictyostelium purpureum]|uniref:G domain-containing protein n=1 Tax=Dictyostelium purpureum TaxID=5786 RepID=F0ZQ34_DICPU|nr:uncharacterized protein DICPUDRAFT_80300 [Dictyostelium purpureum]EGC33940.1 hypothetical protein DICPUDRAFT_80300 [Dictyostelium purpureum]|eukprot:XP_003289522.1 hypothetical protein DICPUDRAFT_80300 [Dictyostelium purpureum]